jgi:hypothetical protein
MWPKLKWICDVAELIRSYPGMDWTGVLKRARGSGTERMLSLGLFLAHDLLGPVLPADILRTAMASPAVRSAAHEVRGQLFLDADNPSSVLKSLLFQMRITASARRRISYFLGTIIVPTQADWQALRLPAFSYPLYYLLRPIRLLGKHGRRVLTQFLQPRNTSFQLLSSPPRQGCGSPHR